MDQVIRHVLPLFFLFGASSPSATSQPVRKPYKDQSGGIGATMQEKPEGILLAPLSGSPAERAGIKENDLLIAVDGVKPKGIKQAISLTRGPAGTKVRLRVIHKGTRKPADISIIRVPLRSILPPPGRIMPPARVRSRPIRP